MNYKLNLSLFFSFILMFMSLFMFILSIWVIIHDKLVFMEMLVISLNSVNFYMSLIFDWMSFVFLSLVMFISSVVLFYSEEYMNLDLNKNRFMMLVIMFVISMIFLIVSPNLISILIGWDGLGLVSYSLVIYYQNEKSYNAGMLTALSNRVGDVAILLSIAWMMNFGSWHFIFFLEKFDSMFMMLMIVIAAFTKSAQLPFSAWLPAAMAAPTPVSALVHSSTLVTAGVYLLIRFNKMILNMYLIDLLIMISLLTMIMSSLSANYEFDLKKIIALSTLSQLGFMMSTLMMGFPTLTFFHLLVHALFKALLFLSAGMIIHCMWGNQDIRFMGGLIMQMPMTTMCLNISNLALCGIPFLSGYYSKDLILEYLMMSSLNLLFFFLFMISVGLTVMYSFRLSFYSLSLNLKMFSYLSIYDNSKLMLLSMIFLMSFSIFGGSLLMWLLFSTPILIFLPMSMKLFTLMFIFMGIWLGYEINYLKIKLNKISLISFFLGYMWFLPMFSTFFMSNKLFNFTYIYFKSIDLGWGEYLGAFGLKSFLINFSWINQKFQMNNFKIYLLGFFIWMWFMFLMI